MNYRFWGKLGQSEVQSSTEFFQEPSPFFDLVFNPECEIQTVKSFGNLPPLHPLTHWQRIVFHLRSELCRCELQD